MACVLPATFPLAHPILPPGRDGVEPSYRYGSTQDGRREPHHGVEFINPAGTPVHAAASGLVVAAGSDDKASFADMVNFYGKLVVLKHDIPGLAQPLYTL
ncbi:MAG: M23 family metallopeptidase [Anaerolineales bacterium]|nr:M23 family metallopeptidase [Anaerolineales bacterium]